MSLLLCIIIKSQLLIYTNENKNKQQFLYKVKNTPKKKKSKMWHKTYDSCFIFNDLSKSI